MTDGETARRDDAIRLLEQVLKELGHEEILSQALVKGSMKAGASRVPELRRAIEAHASKDEVASSE